MSKVAPSPLVDLKSLNIATGKSQRDFALFINGLLPFIDVVSLLSAAFIAINIYASWFAAADFAQGRIDARYVMAALALLAPILLYDKRFIAVASRGHMRALARCYATGFLLFAGSVLTIVLACDIQRVIPLGVLGVWLLLTLAFTAASRVLLAVSVEDSVHNGWLVDAIAVVGAGPQAERLVEHLKQTKPFTPEVLGVFADAGAHFGVVENDGHIAESVAPTGSIDDLLELGKTRRIDWIFLAAPYTDQEKLAAVVNRLKALAVPIAVCPQQIDHGGPYRMIDYVGGVPVTLLQPPPTRWRAKLRSMGQFLPRWMVTLSTLIAIFGELLWMRLRASQSVRAESRRTLVCEIDNHTLESFLQTANGFGQQRFGYAVTPNVDHVIRLHDDPKFRALYREAEYVLMDSRFLNHALRFMGRTTLPVCPGSDVTSALLESLRGTDERVVIVGGGVLQVDELARRYGLTNLAHHNPPMGFARDEAAVEKCVEFIEAHSPFRFCFLALGSPQQEMLAHRLQTRAVARGLTLCVGASIDFLTGAERRAPLWLQRIGFEWLFRLVQNPARLAKRYLVRCPRIFLLLNKTTFVLRGARAAKPAAVVVPPAEAA